MRGKYFFKKFSPQINTNLNKKRIYMQFDRTEKLICKENVEKIKSKKVIIFGVGGVGSFVCEGLARAGVGFITIVDSDKVSISNINRQIIALHSTIGRPKVEVMKERILDINPNAKVHALQKFVSKENLQEFNLKEYDFVIDAIDNITAKIELAVMCENLGINLISCMGTGNKLKPELFEIDDIYKTSVCPLAKVMRRELKAREVSKLTVLYSKEQPINLTGERTPASISFTPSIAGLRIAEYVIHSFISYKA